ncbi:MAG: DoxX family protein [Rhodospirillales bacterium]|nr:DoxX family protein [Rhodospirillales bacterium]
MTPASAAASAVAPAVEAFAAARDFLSRLPQPALDLAFRIGIASVFFKSGLVKIGNWTAAVALFRDEYRVPILPPEAAALLATVAELTCPMMLILGLGARLGAAALLAMTAVIQIFVYPANWSEHLIWAAPLAHLLTRGPGRWSIDELIARRWLDGSSAVGVR